MSSSELFYLKWNNFQKNVRRMRDEVDLVDVTFACDGKKIGAHKLVLYSCSPYFKDLLKDNPANSHPIFYMNNVKFDVLKAILEYMYLGEVHITNENLKDFIKTAEALQIRGLSKENSNDENLLAVSPDNLTDTINIDDEFGRKRQSLDDQIQQTFSSGHKRLRIVTNDSIEEEDDEVEEEEGEIPIRRHKGSQMHTLEAQQNVQPKIETLEFLDETKQHIQQQTTKQQQSQTIPTYCNMDSFTEKTNTTLTNRVTNDQQNTTQYIQASTSQQQPSAATDYKSEEEAWIDKNALDMGSNSLDESSLKNSRNIKNSANYKANCLTPRSCPVCARVYSNVSNLRQHMRLIHNPTAVICPICQKHFNSDLYLKRHYASIHSINAPGEPIDGVEKNSSSGGTNNSGNWTNNSYNDGLLP